MDSDYVLYSKDSVYRTKVPFIFQDNPHQYQQFMDVCYPQHAPWRVDDLGETKTKNEYLEMFL